MRLRGYTAFNGQQYQYQYNCSDGLLFTITCELEWAILQQQWQLCGNTDQQRRMRFSGHAEPHGEPDAGHASRNLAGKLLSIPTCSALPLRALIPFTGIPA